MLKLFNLNRLPFPCFLIFLMLLSASAARGCSCEPPPTVDKELARSENVAVFKILSVTGSGENQRYPMLVEKVFKGALKPGETVVFGPGFACSWTFDKDDEGREMLFYLDERPTGGEPWIAGFCRRSGGLRSTAADRLYLEKESRMRGRTRLSGDLNRLVENAFADVFNFEPLARRKVLVEGRGRRFELETDENGVYEIYDLKPGRYRVTPEKIDGLKPGGESSTEVKITARSHTEENFHYEIDNRISGRVFSPDGKPMQNVCLDLVPLQTVTAKVFGKASCTSKDGVFAIDGIPEGRYYLAVNKNGEPRLSEPFGTFYYPNVRDREAAAVFTFAPNVFVRDLKIVPPEMIPVVTIGGRLTYRDGRPAAGQTVYFLRGKETAKGYQLGNILSDYYVKTDADGRFAFRTLRGQGGVLRGVFFTYAGEYPNCPEIDALLKQPDGDGRHIDTDDIAFDAGVDRTDIELRFPFAACRKTN
ncbi:MAG: carboxypeptidase regulatory-like domain-containing protein [Acidobacteria bacterium]|nr:carboxypeptidase regulatory-like domain-containing protein [Acidobacteriota bacterium]